MEAFLISLSSVAIAEMGDRTQLLSLMLAARYRRAWPILAGVLVATIANHALAGLLGRLFGSYLTPQILDGAVGVSMVAMGLWTLKPDTLSDKEPIAHAGVFLTTLVAFFIAEIGDKTQIATIALAAAYSNVVVVVAGTTLGMMIANAPVIVLGQAFASRLPLKLLNICAALLFTVVGLVFIIRAIRH